MNLAQLPDSQRAEIERDKQRWLKAWRLTMRSRPAEIRAWLQRVESEDEKNDWRRRLNALRHRSPCGR